MICVRLHSLGVTAEYQNLSFQERSGEQRVVPATSPGTG